MCVRGNSKWWGGYGQFVVRVCVRVRGCLTGRGELAGRRRSQCCIREQGVEGITLNETESFLLCGVLARAFDVVGAAATAAHAGAGGGRERWFVVVSRGAGFAVEDVGEGELATVAVGWGVGCQGGVGRFVGERLRAGRVCCVLIAQCGWEAVDMFFGFLK